jgi:hypothetical protein
MQNKRDVADRNMAKVRGKIVAIDVIDDQLDRVCPRR